MLICLHLFIKENYIISAEEKTFNVTKCEYLSQYSYYPLKILLLRYIFINNQIYLTNIVLIIYISLRKFYKRLRFKKNILKYENRKLDMPFFLLKPQTNNCLSTNIKIVVCTCLQYVYIFFLKYITHQPEKKTLVLRYVKIFLNITTCHLKYHRLDTYL